MIAFAQATPEWIGQALGPSGVVVLVLFILWSGVKGWWVFGSHYREAIADRDYYRDRLLHAVDTVEAATRVADKVTTGQDG